MKKFNVIVENINSQKMIPYDVIPYLVHEYKEAWEKPTTFEEFRDFVKRKAQYQWWGRCEYEIILSSWPNPKNREGEKWDVYQQLMLNLDVVTNLLMESINE